MSVRGGRAKLLGIMKDLMVKWDQTTDEWNDPVSREIETRYLEPLDRSVRNAMGAMEQMAQLLERAKRECR
jgi:hypothetical protein